VKVPDDFARYVVQKGSITIDGISLTVANWYHFVTPLKKLFTVETAIIPYTYEHTNIRDRKPGDAVNLEGDILGKYVERYLEARSSKPMTQISLAELTKQGF
jgi:riboflavin synthase